MKQFSTIFLSILMLSILTLNLSAESSDLEKAKSAFTKQGQSNVGNDFWISVPPAYVETYNPTDFTKLFITSAYTQTIRVESIAGIQKIATVQANDVIEVNLTPEEAQPYMFKFPQADVPPSQVYPGKGIHVFGPKPFTMYVICRYTATTDGYLAIPTAALGKDYVVTPYGSFPWSSNSKFPAMVTIVGTQDNTRVTVRVGGNTIASIITDKGEKFPGEEFVYKLDVGDVLLLSNPRDLQIISGTTVRASKPVAVQSGMFCTQIPIGNTACDYTVEMDLPVQTWGKNYHIPLTLNRTNSNILRIFAKEDDTKVYRDGNEVILLPFGLFTSDVGTQEAQGWQETRIWPMGITPPKIATYSGSKPIYITLYNQGASEDNAQYNNPDRDPFSMIITPIEQYQNAVAFCSPGINGGNPFTKNYLAIVYETDENGQMPDSLLFGEAKGGEIDWIPLKQKDNTSDPEYYRLINSDIPELKDTPFANTRFKYKRVDLDPAGIYLVKSPKKFALYSFGGAYYDSYGYPTSSALADLETPDTLAPTLTWDPDCKGVINGAVSLEQPVVDLANVSGFAYLDILETETINYEISNLEMGEANDDGKILSGNFNASPIDTKLYGKLTIYAYDKAGNDTTFVYEYFPEESDNYAVIGVVGDKYKEDYGLLEENELSTKAFEIKNTSLNRELKIISIKLQRGTQGFVIDNASLVLPKTLLPQESASFTIDFQSAKSGAFQDSIIVSTECEVIKKVEINAKVGGPRAWVDDVEFAYYTISSDPLQNTPKERTFSVYNKCNETNEEGQVNLKIIGFDGPFTGVFTPVSLPTNFEVVKGIPQEFTLQFLPTAPGEYLDSIVFLAEQGEVLCDLVCIIKGKAGKAGLVIQGMDWGRVNLFDLENPVASTDQGEGQAITVTNLAEGDQADIRLKDFTIKSSLNLESDNAFYFDVAKTENLTAAAAKNKFNGIVIAKNAKSPTSVVYFGPATTGDYQIEYGISGEAVANTAIKFGDGEADKYTLKGTVYVPNIHITAEQDKILNEVNFSRQAIPNKAPNQYVYISNTNFKNNGLYGGEVTYSLGLSPKISLASDGNATVFEILSAKVAGANYDLANLTDLKLGYGQTVELEVSYYNGAESVDQATIAIVAHNANDGTKFTPTGLFNDIVTLNGEMTLPIGESGSKDPIPQCSGQKYDSELYPDKYEHLYVYNGLSDPFEVMERVTIQNNKPALYNFTITKELKLKADGVTTEEVLSYPLTLQSGEKLVYLYTYVPYQAFQNEKIDFVFKTNLQTEVNKQTITLNSFVVTGETKADVTASVKINKGDYFIYSVDLENNSNDLLKTAQIYSIDFKVSYRVGFVKLDHSTIKLTNGHYNDNFYIQNLEVKDQFRISQIVGKEEWWQEVSMRIESKNSTPINELGEIFNMRFNVAGITLPEEYLKNLGKDPLNIYTYDPAIDNGADHIKAGEIAYEVIPNNNDCGSLLSNDPPIPITVSLNCIDNYRGGITTGAFNNKSKITPSPVTSAGANLDFELALPGHAIVQIYNNEGVLVATLHEGELSYGKHSFALPVDKMTSGMYHYKVTTPFVKYDDKFMLNK